MEIYFNCEERMIDMESYNNRTEFGFSLAGWLLGRKQTD
jgi:hypothetical protein